MRLIRCILEYFHAGHDFLFGLVNAGPAFYARTSNKNGDPKAAAILNSLY